MKFLQEILNIYDLHQNPEQLTGFDKADNHLTRAGRWSFIHSDSPRWTSSDPSHPAVVANAGKSSAFRAIQTMISATNEDIHDEDTFIHVIPYTPAKFKELASADANVFIKNAKTKNKVNEYKSIYNQFLKSVSQLQPLSIINFGSTTTFGVGVIELDPAIVETAVDSLYGDGPEPDGDDMGEDEEWANRGW